MTDSFPYEIVGTIHSYKPRSRVEEKKIVASFKLFETMIHQSKRLYAIS